MNTYFVKGRYIGEYAQEIDFGIVFDLCPVNAENFKRQIYLELGINKYQRLYIEQIVRL
jgi:hypothetical protein